MKGSDEMRGGDKIRADAIEIVVANVEFWEEYLLVHIYSNGHVEADRILEAAKKFDEAAQILKEAMEEIKCGKER